MPAPSAAQLEGVATGAVQGAGLDGEHAPDLAKAMAATVADALGLLHASTLVLPGIPAAAPPPAGSGATAGPGMLLPAAASGLSASAIEGIAAGHLQANGIAGEHAGDLATWLGACLEQALSLFTAQVMVAPGIPIAGFATAGPGSLI